MTTIVDEPRRTSGDGAGGNRDGSAERVDLRRSLRLALTNCWIVVLCTALGAGTAYLLARSKTNVYSSTTVVRILDPSSASPDAAASARVDPARQVEIEVLYARSAQVADEVDRRLGPSRARLIRTTSVSGSDNSDTIEISVESSDADRRPRCHEGLRIRIRCRPPRLHCRRVLHAGGAFALGVGGSPFGTSGCRRPDRVRAARRSGRKPRWAEWATAGVGATSEPRRATDRAR